MPTIQGGMIIEGALGRAIAIPGAPSAGTNEVQTLTIGGTPTGGTFQLRFEGLTTAAITWSATNATLLANMNAALDALPSVGTSGLVAAAGTLTAGIGTVTLTAGAALARKALPLVEVANNSLTGTNPTLAIAETTPGVNATYRGAATGSMVVRTDTGVVSVNTSATAGAPTWTNVGAQS
jgi:hypothetical protein